MKKILLLELIFLTLVFYSCTAQEKTVYVSAAGNDTNSGLTETAPFKTLTRALESVKETRINTITVIGTLNEASESAADGADDPYAVFYIKDSGKDEIIITGKQRAREDEKAVLSAADADEKRVISIIGDSNILFRNIRLTGENRSKYSGGGIRMDEGAAVTLGNGAEVSGNTALSGGGVLVSNNSSLTISGGTIQDNTAKGGGGGGVFAASGSRIIISSGGISNNTVTASQQDGGNGGGISAQENSTVTISGGTIDGNKANFGGGLFVVASSAVTISGGFIQNNIAEVSGGGIFAIINSNITLSNGIIQANTASSQAGGVYVNEDCTFTWEGGSVSGNIAPQFSNIYPPKYEAKTQKETTPAADNGRSSGGGRVSGKYVTAEDDILYGSFEFVGDGVCFVTYGLFDDAMIRMPMDYEIRGNRVIIKMEGQSGLVFDIKDKNTLISIGGILLPEGVVFTKR